MPHNLLNTLQRFKHGKFYSLPALGKALGVEDRAAAGLDPHRARVGAAQLRRQEGHRGARAAARRTGSRRRRAPTRSRSSSRASCCRTSPACRCSPTSPRCAASPQSMGKDPKMIEPLVPVDLVVDHSVQVDHYGTQGRARPQHEARVQAQRRALPVHEVGHAGVRHLQGRAARHRHRAPGEPRVPGARRAQEGRRLLPRHAGRHRQPHHDDQRHRRGRLGRGRHRGRGRHARPAGVLPHARRGRREPHRQAARRRAPPPTWCSPSPRCCARRRWSASSSSSSAKAPRRCRVPDRATIANMAPEYGATMGFFPVDETTHRLLPRHRPHRPRRSTPSRPTSRRRACSACRSAGEIDYSEVLELDLATVTPVARRPEAPAGPHRARQREEHVHRRCSPRRSTENGFDKTPGGPRQALTRRYDGIDDRQRRRADRRHHLLHQHLEPQRAARRRPAGEEGGRDGPDGQAAHQDLARARARASSPSTSTKAGLLPYLEKLGFNVAPTAAPPASATPAPLAPPIDEAIVKNDLVCAAVLSGNRNFEARIHPNIKANFLASPPLVVAYAIAGTVLHRPDDRAARHGARTASRSTSATSGRRARRGRGAA